MGNGVRWMGVLCAADKTASSISIVKRPLFTTGTLRRIFAGFHHD
jgi:hypothetical protein